MPIQVQLWLQASQDINSTLLGHLVCKKCVGVCAQQVPQRQLTTNGREGGFGDCSRQNHGGFELVLLQACAKFPDTVNEPERLKWENVWLLGCTDMCTIIAS